MKNMNDFYQKFDKIFAEVCANVPQNNTYDIIGTETSRWKLLVNEKGIVTIETQYTPPEIEPDYFYCVYGGVVKVLNNILVTKL